MNCEKYEKLVSLYIDDQLDQQGREKFEKHLASCDLCRHEVAFLQSMIMDISSLETIQPPEGFHKELMAKIELDSKIIPLPMNRRKWVKNIKIISALAAVFVFSMILIKPLKVDLFNDQMPEIGITEESIEESIEESQKDSQDKMIESPVIEYPREEEPRDLPEEPSVELAKESKSPADMRAQAARDLPEVSTEEIPRDTQTDSLADLANNSTIKSSVEEVMPPNHEARVFTLEEKLVEERWTVMTSNYSQDIDHILGLGQELGIQTNMVEMTGTEELQDQIMTIQMTISTEQKSELDSKIMGLEKKVEAPDDEVDKDYPQIIQLIIIVKER